MTVTIRNPLIRTPRVTADVASGASPARTRPGVLARPRASTLRRSRRPQYRYIITPLEALFSTAQRSADADRQSDAIDRQDAARVLGGGLLILVVVSMGMAVAIKQFVFVAMKLLGA